MYDKCCKVFILLLYLCANKMLVVMDENRKMFVIIANREDLIRKKQSGFALFV